MRMRNTFHALLQSSSYSVLASSSAKANGSLFFARMYFQKMSGSGCFLDAFSDVLSQYGRTALMSLLDAFSDMANAS